MNIHFFIGSAVAVQHKDSGPWMHGVVEEANSTDHKGYPYIITVTKEAG